MSENGAPVGRLQRLFGIAAALGVHTIFAVLAVAGILVINAMGRAWLAGEAGMGEAFGIGAFGALMMVCLLYTSPSPRDQRGSRMPSSA